MFSRLFYIVSIFCVFFYKVCADAGVKTAEEPRHETVDDRTKLWESLFENYDKRVNPDNVTTKFGISLINFSVNDQRSILDSNVWLKYVWTDERLKWDSKEHAGITVLRVDADDVWKPDITLYNSADLVNMVNCWHSNVLVFPNGEILWVPPCKLSSQCHFTTQRDPYGEQTCSLKFGSWTYDGNILDMQFYNDTKAIDLSDKEDNPGFEIVSTTAARNVRYYSCCAEPYVDLTFNLTLARLPGEELVKRD